MIITAIRITLAATSSQRPAYSVSFRRAVPSIPLFPMTVIYGKSAAPFHARRAAEAAVFSPTSGWPVTGRPDPQCCRKAAIVQLQRHPLHRQPLARILRHSQEPAVIHVAAATWPSRCQLQRHAVAVMECSPASESTAVSACAAASQPVKAAAPHPCGTMTCKPTPPLPANVTSLTLTQTSSSPLRPAAPHQPAGCGAVRSGSYRRTCGGWS